MKNYWLEEKEIKEEIKFIKYLSGARASRVGQIYALNRVLKLYQHYPDHLLAKNQFVERLHWVANQVVSRLLDYYQQKKWAIAVDKDDLIQECVLCGLEIAPRFNWEKVDCSFRFFITCMGGKLSQLRRSTRNYNELKKRYEEHLKIS